MGRIRRLIAALAVGWAAAVLFAGPAAAHAALATITPADGASLEVAPAQVRLSFTEPPDVGSVVTVLDTRGREVARADAADGASLTVALPALEVGTYTVDWRIISATDGHPTQGVTVFGVGTAAGPAAVTVTQPGPAPAAVAGRVLVYAGLLVVLGGVAAGLAIYDPGQLPGPRWLLAGPALAAVGLALLGQAAVTAAAPASVAEVAASNPGRWWLVRVAATVAMAAAAAATTRRVLVPRLVVLGVTAAALALAVVASGHAAAPDPTRWLELASQASHVLAAGIWVGGLGWLAAGLGAGDRAMRVVRFSRLAAASLAVVAVTGLWRAIDELGGWAGLWGTGWGRTLAVKAALVGLLVAGGAWNRWRGIPALAADRRPLRQGLRVEMAATVGVLAVTGLLATLGPGRPAAAATAPTASGTDYAGTTRLTVTLAGPGRLEAEVDSPTPASAVTIHAVPTARPDQPPAVLTLDLTGPGRYAGPAKALATGGVWELDATVTGPSGVGVSIDDLRLAVVDRSGTT